MVIRIDPKPDESLRACQAMATAVAADLPRSRAGWIIIAAYVLVSGAAYLVGVRDWPLVGALAFGGLFGALMALQWEARWRARRLVTLDPHNLEPHHVEVTDAGVRAWCEHVDMRLTWDGITRVAETSDFYVFVRGSGGGPTVPKRVLSDAEDAAIRDLICRWAPDGGAFLARASTAGPPA